MIFVSYPITFDSIVERLIFSDEHLVMGGRLGLSLSLSLSMSMMILDSTLYYVRHWFLKGDTSRGVSSAALVLYDDFQAERSS
ncbi:hypothetical protein EYC80_005215 [Monilinia laxa]|uniref:Uncharacterized protein n=1 Tax=Monilinia laxa TaxID=61186 RepID=A0A5N6KJ98_MONLA|nr:hypothetical protein EYC80_005215 [Monilinia laxa]